MVGLTVVLPPKRTDFRGDLTSTLPGLMSSLFTASNIAAAAFVWIWRFTHPSGFGADCFDRGIGAGQEKVTPSIPFHCCFGGMCVDWGGCPDFSTILRTHLQRAVIGFRDVSAITIVRGEHPSLAITKRSK